MPCENEALVHAYLDGALDPPKALEVEKHLWQRRRSREASR